MWRSRKNRPARTVIWGLFLIALGLAFLFERTGLIGVSVAARFWPAVLFVIAVIHVVERRFGAAVMFVGLGAWFLAVNFGWRGLTYSNSWGLVLVAGGLGIVVRALTGDDRPRHREEEEASHV